MRNSFKFNKLLLGYYIIIDSHILVFDAKNESIQKYKKYYTNIKTCYALGIQHEILPEKFIKEIPSSTSHYWKYEDPKKYIGDELAKGI